MSDSLKILKKYWGYDSFRPLQEDIINSVLAGNDTLALMPTGGGKSITFQIPALHKDGICIVITPLIALMKDQVENLKKRQIRAISIHSGMNRLEQRVAFENALYGNFKFMYVSPERLATEEFREKIKQFDINLIAVDESHCISQWGYDFRPSYLNISEFRKIFPKIPVLALTATATPDVVKDIQDKLAFRKINVLKKSFLRDNLSYLVRYTEDKQNHLLQVCKSLNGSGVVYTRSRRRTREFAEFLARQGISADYYHAGLKNEVREEKQENWISGKYRVIVATNAFGMGIDKADVRYVVHVDLPDSIEAYFQEAGRAGRDEKKSFAVLLVGPNDSRTLKTRISKSFPDIKYIHRVYHAIGNYCGVGIGGGIGRSYDFNLFEFCQKFKFNIVMTNSALNILQLESYIELSDSLKSSSRLMMIVNRDDLYKFQFEHKDSEDLLKLILRSYAGLFSQYVNINEEFLAARLALSTDDVYQKLLMMNREGIMNYIPKKKNPFLTYMTERLDLSNLLITKKNYSERKIRYTKKINAMISYCESKTLCRNKMLLEYFGEKYEGDCGNCDVCRQRKQTFSSQKFNRIQDKIIELLKDKTYTILKLSDKLEFKKEEIVFVLNELMVQRKIYEDDNLILRLN